MAHPKQRQIGKEQAIELGRTEWWKSKTSREIAEFCMSTAELCCPFGVFHEAIEKTLGRPVFTHELGMNFDGIWGELFHGDDPPSFQEIMDLIPADKRIVAVI